MSAMNARILFSRGHRMNMIAHHASESLDRRIDPVVHGGFSLGIRVDHRGWIFADTLPFRHRTFSGG